MAAEVSQDKGSPAASKRFWGFLGALGLGLVLSSYVVWAAEELEPRAAEPISNPSIADELSRLREGLSPLDFKRITPGLSAVGAYFEFYGLNLARHEHYFGTFRSGRHVLAAHAFHPETPRGTVMLMHGFLDHVGTLSSTIHRLLEQGFAVAAYDAPGHGLSSGPRASIEDFADYAAVFEDFLELVRAHMPAPYDALAHSTGAAILVNHLLTHDDNEIEHVVLIAPLVRSAYWQLSRMLGPVLDVFVDDVPRVFRDNTSDEQFLEFTRRDPLQARQTSLDWFDALVEWNERITQYPPSAKPIVIIQGNADSVVDWEYNLEFLKTKFPNARIEIIEGGRHQLLNEGPALRARVLQLVDEALAGTLSP